MVGVDNLWPLAGAHSVADVDLESRYAYPDDLAQPWVRVNFVSSLDGAVTVEGRSDGLSAPTDKQVFALIRSLSDVILVGAGTAEAEGYRGVRPHEIDPDLRRRHRLSEVPPIAVVTRRCSVTPESPLVTDTVTPPLVLTCQSAPVERRQALLDAGVEVIVAGTDDVDLRAGLLALGERGLRRVGCEGGPRLFGTLIEKDLVDELCLTISPLLAGGPAGRIAQVPLIDSVRRMRLLSALHADESLLLLRYGRLPR